jgi:predicted DsbA family dithiol-disulfide isomerase
MTETPLTIDVVSDVVCPWCYLGKRRLERALAAVGDQSNVVRWQPFRLDPTIPPEGINRDTYLTGKFGNVHAVDEAHRRLTEMGRNEGIDYHFERITRSPNTIDAHRLVRWAARDGKEEAMVERLFAAYFRDGLDVGDHEVLAQLAREVGVGDGNVAERLAGDDDRREVVGAIEDAYRIGVSGVPCFIIDRRYAVMGAQPAEVLVRAIAQADTERKAAPASAG